MRCIGGERVLLALLYLRAPWYTEAAHLPCGEGGPLCAGLPPPTLLVLYTWAGSNGEREPTPQPAPVIFGGCILREIVLREVGYWASICTNN